jgi:hypothetical protein
MAPERLNGYATGPSSDLWSLGASLYTAVEGRGAFERGLPAAVAAAVLLHEPPFPSRAGRELGGLLMAMLAKDPAARPGAAQVRERLGRPPGSGRGTGRRGWLPLAVLAAVVVLGGGGWYGLTVLNRPDTGRYATAPDPCGLLTDAQARDLAGGAATRTRTRDGECVWQVRPGSRLTRSITVRTRAERPDGGYSGPAVAKLRYDSERASRDAAKGVLFRKSTGGAADVPGVGEAAFVQDTYELYMGVTRSGRSDSTVLFRDGNLVGEVIWHREDVPASSPAGRPAVLRIARLVSAALRN